jgi:hypothetical protein
VSGLTVVVVAVVVVVVIVVIIVVVAAVQSIHAHLYEVLRERVMMVHDSICVRDIPF